jgi:hypothetical protein
MKKVIEEYFGMHDLYPELEFGMVPHFKSDCFGGKATKLD